MFENGHVKIYSFTINVFYRFKLFKIYILVQKKDYRVMLQTCQRNLFY